MNHHHICVGDFNAVSDNEPHTYIQTIYVYFFLLLLYSKTYQDSTSLSIIIFTLRQLKYHCSLAGGTYIHTYIQQYDIIAWVISMRHHTNLLIIYTLYLPIYIIHISLRREKISFS